MWVHFLENNLEMVKSSQKIQPAFAEKKNVRQHSRFKRRLRALAVILIDFVRCVELAKEKVRDVKKMSAQSGIKKA